MKKNLTAALIISAMTILNASSAFAGTNISNISSVDISGSYVGTIVSQETSSISARGGDINITDVSVDTISGSIVDTGIYVKSKTIEAEGRNINITSADALGVDSSLADTLVNDVYKSINVRETDKGRENEKVKR